MIKKVLWSFLAVVIIGFLIVWVWTGGPKKAWQEAQSISYFDPSGEKHFRLPWQPEIPQGPDLSLRGDTGTISSGSPTQDIKSKLAEYEKEFNELNQKALEAKTFGTPSPHRGKVLLTKTGYPQENTPASEYIEIQASSANTAPVDLAGWSFQSAYTGIRLYIPPAASPFIMGTVNKQESVQLEPGDGAIVVSGSSPVGTSFRENSCTGYLNQLQSFSPSLFSSCPAPSSALPMTPDNLRLYGETCFDFIATIPHCTFPMQMPITVSSRCASFIANNLSYNGCVAQNRYKSSFASNMWRIYLNSPTEAWRNSHDIIRLLDREGRTVDILTY